MQRRRTSIPKFSIPWNRAQSAFFESILAISGTSVTLLMHYAAMSRVHCSHSTVGTILRIVPFWPWLSSVQSERVSVVPVQVPEKHMSVLVESRQRTEVRSTVQRWRREKFVRSHAPSKLVKSANFEIQKDYYSYRALFGHRIRQFGATCMRRVELHHEKSVKWPIRGSASINPA